MFIFLFDKYLKMKNCAVFLFVLVTFCFVNEHLSCRSFSVPTMEERSHSLPIMIPVFTKTSQLRAGSSARAYSKYTTPGVGCLPGYSLQNKTCIDINECETRKAECYAETVHGNGREICINSQGSYKCVNISCPEEYKFDSRSSLCFGNNIQCPPKNWDCLERPYVISHNFITFVSNLPLSDTPLKLFSIRGPQIRSAIYWFELKLLKVQAGNASIQTAVLEDFLLTKNGTECLLSLTRSLEGPQSIELELSMELYVNKEFQEASAAKIFIYVSEYPY